MEPLPNPLPFRAHCPCWRIALCLLPLRETASLLAHRPMSDSDIICNSPSLPLTDIVLLGFPFQYSPCWAFPFNIPLKVFKTRLLGINTLIKGVSFSSPTDVGSHNHTVLYQARILFLTAQTHCDISALTRYLSSSTSRF